MEGNLDFLPVASMNVEENSPWIGEGGKKGNTREKRKKNKLIKKKEISLNLVFGVDLQINEAMDTTEVILVGRAKGKKYSANYIKEWTTNTWKEALDQSF